MRSFKDVADRHVVSLDNKQLALFTSGAVVAAGLFFLTGVLYGTRVSPSSGSLGGVSTLGSGSGTGALRLPADSEDSAGETAPGGTKEMAAATNGSTVVPVGKAVNEAERKKLLEQYSREAVGTEPPVAGTPVAAAAPAAKPAAGASQPAKPMAQIPPPASGPAPNTALKPGGVITVKPPDTKAAAAKTADSKTGVTKVAVVETSKSAEQPLLRGRTLASMKGPLTVQVAAYTDKGTAKKELDRWTKQRFPAFLGAETVKGKKLYRVQIGRFSDRKQAEKARDVLVKDLHLKGPKVADAVK